MSHMNLAVLWVTGDKDALKSMLAKDAYTPNREWQKGDSKGRDGTHQTSGFSVVLADSTSPGEMMKQVRVFLADCILRADDFGAMGLLVELSIGVTVGSDPQFMASVALKTEDLAMLSSTGIALSISAYPSSDDSD
jgi:hypothetical protein